MNSPTIMIVMRMLVRMMTMGTMNCDEAVTKFLNSHPCVAVDWIKPLVHLQRRLENQNIWTIMMLLNYYDEDNE